MNTTTKSATAFLSAREVMAEAGISRSTLYRLIAAGGFPAPVKIGYMSRWPANEVEAWKAKALQTRAQAA